MTLKVNKAAPKWHTIAFGALTGAVYGIEFFTEGVSLKALILLALNIAGYAIIPVFRLGDDE
jgi:multidrug transporter EmrE-like cation transporter